MYIQLFPLPLPQLRLSVVWVLTSQWNLYFILTAQSGQFYKPLQLPADRVKGQGGKGLQFDHICTARLSKLEESTKMLNQSMATILSDIA